MWGIISCPYEEVLTKAQFARWDFWNESYRKHSRSQRRSSSWFLHDSLFLWYHLVWLALVIFTRMWSDPVQIRSIVMVLGKGVNHVPYNVVLSLSLASAPIVRSAVEVKLGLSLSGWMVIVRGSGSKMRWSTFHTSFDFFHESIF